MPTIEERLTTLERDRDALVSQISDLRDTLVQGFGASHRRLSRLEADVAEIKADIVEIKSDIVEIKGRLTRLEADVASMKADVASMKASVEFLHANMADIVMAAVERALDRRFPPQA